MSTDIKRHKCSKCGAECLASPSGWLCPNNIECGARVVLYRVDERDKCGFDIVGGVATGSDDEASTPCRDCDGTGKVECGECWGTGTVTCEYDHEHDCPDCDGSGELDCEECEDDV